MPLVLRKKFLGWLLDQVFEHCLLRYPLVYGDRRRLRVAPRAVFNNALLNLLSRMIEFEEFAFCGRNVALLTRTHNHGVFGAERLAAIPNEGCDIVVRRGAWLGTNSTVLGPAVVGCHAVVAAGAVVTGDVPDYAIVAGIPARVVGWSRTCDQ